MFESKKKLLQAFRTNFIHTIFRHLFQNKAHFRSFLICQGTLRGKKKDADFIPPLPAVPVGRTQIARGRTMPRLARHRLRLATLALLALASSATARTNARNAGTLSASYNGTLPAPSEHHAGAQISVGSEALVGQFPWAVAISFYASLPPQCTGVLVSPTAVLTAAHCIRETPDVFAANALVRIGAVDWRCAEPTSCDVRSVARVFINPEYTQVPRITADIALLILAQPSTKRPVRMASVKAPLGSVAELQGWGTVEPSPAESTPGVQDRLRYTAVQTRASACCNDLYFDADAAFCTRSIGAPSATGFTAGACPGDSGGPMTLAGTDILVGTIAYVMVRAEDANDNTICGRVYASVEMSAARYRPWVASVVADLPPAPDAAEYPAPLPVSGAKCSTEEFPSPSPPPPSPPSPPPSPVPSPAPSCTYSGEYRIAAVGRAACGAEYASYGSSVHNQSLCATQSVQLRSAKQLPNPDRGLFRITRAGAKRHVVGTARRGCTAGEARWTPVGARLRLINGSAATWVIEPVGTNCSVVSFRSGADDFNAPYVSAPIAVDSRGCRSRELYFTMVATVMERQTFVLSQVA